MGSDICSTPWENQQSLQPQVNFGWMQHLSWAPTYHVLQPVWQALDMPRWDSLSTAATCTCTLRAAVCPCCFLLLQVPHLPAAWSHPYQHGAFHGV